jgi:uncharacterized phage protein gp47/JayE
MSGPIFGLTSNGLAIMRQSDIISAFQAQLQAALGQNINVLPQSILGQITNIVAEREALVWELLEAVYNSQYPATAEGTSLDNILALTGLKRLPATPSSAVLTLFGTAGTLIPAGSLVSVLGTPTSQFATIADATIAAAISCIQTISFTSVPTQGYFALAIVDPAGQSLTTPNIQWNASANISNQTQNISFSATPNAGSFVIEIGSLMTSALPSNSTAASVQTAIRALTGYSTAVVTGAFAGGFVVTLPASNQPVMTTMSNSLTSASVPVVIAVTPVISVQQAIQGLYDSTAMNYPFTDALVTGNFNSGFAVAFGAGTPTSGNPSSGLQAINLFTVPASTLENGVTVVNVIPVMTQAGSVAEATVTANCTQTGPIYAPSGTLTVIGSPTMGWASVTNALDAIIGSNIETDTAARARRLLLLGNTGTATLQAIVAAVSAVANVTQCIGFENNNGNVDTAGRPGHSFEIVAVGGAVQDIVDSIYATKAAGIQPYGNTTGEVYDNQGFQHIIQFSRPTAVPIYVSLLLTVNGQFPANGAAQCVEAIVELGNELLIGQTVIVNGTNGLSCAFDEIPGILNFQILVGTAPSPTSSANISIGPEQIATFQSANVIVSYT